MTLERTPEGIRIIYQWISPSDSFLAFMGLLLLPAFLAVTLALVSGEFRKAGAVAGTLVAAGLALLIGKRMAYA